MEREDRRGAGEPGSGSTGGREEGGSRKGKGEGIKNMNATALCFYHILGGFSAIPSAHCLTLVIETTGTLLPGDGLMTRFGPKALKYPLLSSPNLAVLREPISVSKYHNSYKWLELSRRRDTCPSLEVDIFRVLKA